MNVAICWDILKLQVRIMRDNPEDWAISRQPAKAESPQRPYATHPNG